MTDYLPEGARINTPANRAAMRNLISLQEACRRGSVLEARASLCSAGHDLSIELGEIRGLIPKTEGALGMDTGETRDIAVISRVSKPVCFRIMGFERGADGGITAVCSRRSVQRDCYDNYISALVPGDVIPAVVTHMENFGCFADIGCGISSLLPIDAVSVSRISHPTDRFRTGQKIHAVVSGRDEQGRVCLSHKELLGTWEENAANFAPGETVSGIIRSVEDYGVFVELTPNLAGLAEPCPFLSPGQQASVYIKSLIPEKMKVKLIIVDAYDAEIRPEPPRYFITSGHIARWQYSPEGCRKEFFTEFG